MHLLKPLSLFFAIVMAVPFTPHAQSRETDSAGYYEGQMTKMVREAYDSARKSDAFRTLKDNYERLSPYSNKYTSFNLFAEFGGVDFNKFNADNAKSGFGPMSAGPSYRGGIGFTHENKNRLVKEFYLFTFSGDKAAYNGAQKIRYSFGDLFQVNIGYDLIKSPKVNLYPYGGLSIRFETLSWHNPGQINTSYTGIADMLTHEEGFVANNSGLAYHTGLSLDWVIAEGPGGQQAKGPPAGIMLFARAGTEGMIGGGSYKIREVKYDPGIHNGQWIASIGIKFFGRER